MLSSLFLLSFHPFYEVQFFFINRIFKNDLISNCLCALNHVVGPVHKSKEGQGGGRQAPGRGQCPPALLGLWQMKGAGAERGNTNPLLPLSQQIRYVLSGRVLLVNRDPTCSREPFQVMNENKQLHH